MGSMRGGKFYSIPYDARCSVETRYVRRKAGGIAAFGRWIALLGILYEQDGGIDLSDDVMRLVIEDELELKGYKLDEFIGTIAQIGWIEPGPWKERQHVISKGVCDQLEFKRRAAESGSRRKDDGKP